MVDYIDRHKDRFGVEPICKMLPIAPSMYYEMKVKPMQASSPPLAYVSLQSVVFARSMTLSC